MQNTHFHKSWRNVIWNDGACDLWICNLSYAFPGLSTLGIVIRYWPFLPPVLPTRGHINILDSFNKGCNEVCSYGRFDYADASSQIDYLPRIHSVKAVPSIRRLVYSSSDIVGQIVELNVGIRGCSSVLDSGGTLRIFDIHSVNRYVLY